MKPFEFATIGVRLIALGIISFGAVLLSGGMLQRAVMSGSIAGAGTVDLHLQTSLLFGTLVMVASRRIARWIAYDF